MLNITIRDATIHGENLPKQKLCLSADILLKRVVKEFHTCHVPYRPFDCAPGKLERVESQSPVLVLSLSLLNYQSLIQFTRQLLCAIGENQSFDCVNVSTVEKSPALLPLERVFWHHVKVACYHVISSTASYVNTCYGQVEEV